jgi:transposase
LLRPHARTTTRLTDIHRLIGFALGGEAGARLAEGMALPTSPDTLLRRVKQYEGEPLSPPRFVGVDDWAWRKGQSYGTILIDLERGRVIDLLPGRDGSALAAWLKEHPGVEVITRDRWAAFAQAAAEGAPQAQQVADRWHLLKNLREAVERLFGRHAAQVRAILTDAPQATAAPEATGKEAPAPAGVSEVQADEPLHASAAAVPPATEPFPSPREQARQAKHQERAQRYQQVRELHRQGLSLHEIARTTKLSRKAVRRYCREEHCPDWNPGRRRCSQLDAFAASINRWIEGGGANTAELFRQLQQAGCPASYDAVRRYVNHRLGSTGRPGPRKGSAIVPAVAPPSARKLSFEFIRRPENRQADEQARLDRLRCHEATLHEGLGLAEEFAEMVRKRSKVPLSDWLAKAEQSSCAELRGFASSLCQDEAAVAAALTEKWSNGPVEGQVNRLKLIKRQMYGRAGIPLLRARVRFAS